MTETYCNVMLQKLYNNRFALDEVSADEFARFRAEISTMLGVDDPKVWVLLGTDGCHLCDDAEKTIQQACAYRADKPSVVKRDIVDTPILVDTLGKMIPIVIMPHRFLAYPFGLMDLVQG